eukprot:SAG31_NODE_5116_length_2731_cov_1.876900_1_plen_29_part_10
MPALAHDGAWLAWAMGMGPGRASTRRGYS